MFKPSAGDRKSPRQAQSSLCGAGDKTSPISVVLVSSGSRGNKLLFRYPFQRAAECPASLSGNVGLAVGSVSSVSRRITARPRNAELS